MPNRILHVLGNAQREGSGIARIAAGIATAHDRSQYLHEAAFLDRDGPLAARFQQLGIVTHVIPWRHPYRDPFGYFAFRRFLADRHYDLVHFHWGGDRLQRLASKRSKVIFHAHGRVNESLGAAPVFFRADYADAVIAICHSVAKQSQNPKTKVIYPGVDLIAPHDQLSGQPVLGFAGRLVRLKGAHILLQAVRLLSDEFPDLLLEVAGAGPELEDLQRLARSLGIESRVIFPGWLDNIQERFNNWSVFIQPSLEEGLGMGLLHAMGVGMPVVATAIGGVPEIIDDYCNGRLVPARNPLALADAIRDLLLSPTKRKAMGEAAAETIKLKCSLELMASQIASLYEEVLNARS